MCCERIEFVACFRAIVKFMITSLTGMRSYASKSRTRLENLIRIMACQDKNPIMMV